MAKISYAYSGWRDQAGEGGSRARKLIAGTALTATVAVIAVFNVVDQVITPASVVAGSVDCRLNWRGSECGHVMAPDDAVAARWPVRVIAVEQATLPQIETRPAEVASTDVPGGVCKSAKKYRRASRRRRPKRHYRRSN